MGESLVPQPEQEARNNIDRLLTQAGWSVCDATQANIHGARGVAIREFLLHGHGFADYLNVDGKAAGVIEAKKEGIAARDKVRLDIFWLKDDSPSDSENLPDPDVLAAEIVGDLEAALEQFREIAADLGRTEAG